MGGVSSSIPSEQQQQQQQQTHTNVDSSPNSPIPSDSNSPNPKMSDSDSKTPKTLDQDQDQDKEKEKAGLEDSNQSAAKDSDNVENKGEEGVEEEEEEEEECGFCVFMKGGGCKDSFVAWEKCIEEAEKSKEDIVDKCAEITTALTRCMEAHADYYEPILRAEKKAKEEVLKELENEQEKEKEKEKEKVEIASN